MTDTHGLPLAALSIGNAATSVDAVDIITFAASLVGVYLGRRAGVLFRTLAEVIGGAILILIGTRILLDHLDLG